MYARNRVAPAIPSRPIWGGERPTVDASAGIATILALLRRNLLFLTLWVGAWVVCGAVYVKLLRPDFVATTQVLLQPRLIINDGPEDVRHFHQFMIDGEQCETELRVLRSEQLLYRVFRGLNLAEAPEIRSGPDGFWAFLGAKIHLLEKLTTAGDDSIQDFYAFAGRVRSRRLGLSYVIEISYRAHSAKQAAHVVNAIAVAYAAHRLRGVSAREQRRGVYLESRLKSLQAQIIAADTGVRVGMIPDGSMPDADVRLLGPASLPLGASYPKPAPFLVLIAGIGVMTGLLIVVLPQAAPLRGMHRSGRIRIQPKRARIA